MLKIKSSKIKLETSRFSVESLEYTLDGPRVYTKEVIRHPGAVVILALEDNGNQVFVRQPRVALEDFSLELPAGTRNKNEDPLLCAKRELAEEAGLAAREWGSLGEIYPAPGFCDEKLFLYVASGLSEFHLPQDPEERISVLRFSPDQVLKMVLDGSLKDAKSLALLFRARVAGIW